MKDFYPPRWLVLGVLLAIYPAAHSVAQQSSIMALFTEPAEAIRTVDATRLAGFFSSSVDLLLEGRKAVYSRTQASARLADFFKKNPPASFSLAHAGSSKKGILYAIGQYEGKTSKYSLLLKARQDGNQLIIYELNFAAP